MTADMEYMNYLDVTVLDAVTLIRSKTRTYGDSWKRRGGPGAWFTTVRPWDRLEGIVASHGGDIFTAVEADPTGQDGSALACVRDLMNYCILIESHARARLGVKGTVVTNTRDDFEQSHVRAPNAAQRAQIAGYAVYPGKGGSFYFRDLENRDSEAYTDRNAAWAAAGEHFVEWSKPAEPLGGRDSALGRKPTPALRRGSPERAEAMRQLPVRLEQLLTEMGLDGGSLRAFSPPGGMLSTGVEVVIPI